MEKFLFIVDDNYIVLAKSREEAIDKIAKLHEINFNSNRVVDKHSKVEKVSSDAVIKVSAIGIDSRFDPEVHIDIWD
jgi:hypothetical protein